MKTVSLGLSKIFTFLFDSLFVLVGAAALTIGFGMWLTTIIGGLMGFGSEMTTMQLCLWFTAFIVSSVIGSGFMKFINEYGVDYSPAIIFIIVGLISYAAMSHFEIFGF